MRDHAPPTIFDKQRRAAALSRAQIRAQSKSAATYLVGGFIEDIVERLSFLNFTPAKLAITGDPGRRITDALSARMAEASICCDAWDEEQPWPYAPVDLFLNFATLATVNDLPGALLHIRNALTPGGMAILSYPGAGSLLGLRKIMLEADADRPAARLHPMIDNSAASALMQRAGFARQVVDSHTVSVRYSSLEMLVSDLRDQGLGSALVSRGPQVGKAGWKRAVSTFETLADSDGKLLEKFEMLTLTGWR